ncbi:MAG: carboxypeptidase-like regulatory domain-containing protein, partial [Sphingobacterium sp.]
MSPKEDQSTMKYPIIIVLLLLLGLYSMAQSISGQITNETGKPLSDVTVSHIETGTFVSSDSSGRYTI